MAPSADRRTDRAVLAAAAALAGALTLAMAGPTGAGAGRTTVQPASARSDTPARPAAAAELILRPGEGLAAALRRSGVAPAEAAGAATALADDFDVINPHPGLPIQAVIAAHKLRSLSLTPRTGETLTLWTDDGGRWRLRRAAQPADTGTPSLTRGVVHGSLYLSMVEAGAAPDEAAAVADGFGRRLDLSRDINSGDHFRLMFHRTSGAPALVYAEVTSRAGVARLYRDALPGTAAQWTDGEAGPASGGLLRTPVSGARVTSLFGLRLHPLLGFTRIHQGVDFGASRGAPVLAAGDGVIEEARWAGGYGRWLKIRHGSTVETGYGHLSDWAPGVRPGARVRQGEVVAFVGDSGLATGPHLHFEVFDAGRRIDPRLAPARVLAGGGALRTALFRSRRATIDSEVAALAG